MRARPASAVISERLCSERCVAPRSSTHYSLNVRCPCMGPWTNASFLPERVLGSGSRKCFLIARQRGASRAMGKWPARPTCKIPLSRACTDRRVLSFGGLHRHRLGRHDRNRGMGDATTTRTAYVDCRHSELLRELSVPAGGD